jgi:hypothetical protein
MLHQNIAGFLQGMQRCAIVLCQQRKQSNMHQIKTTVLLLCAAVLFAACEKPVLLDGTSDNITGTWNWDYSYGGVAYQEQTPSSTGTKKHITFHADGRYSFFINDAISATGTYTLEDKKCIHSGKQKKWILFSAHPDENRMIESLSGYQLLLSDEAYDGFAARYTRASEK